jgi:hypothetical protein
MVVVRRVAGSMRLTVPSERFATQIDLAPAAIAAGSFPTSTDPVRRAEAGSTREM